VLERRDDDELMSEARRTTVGFAGLGRMGAPMAVHLAAAHDVVVYNRTTAKALEFAAEHGTAAANTPRELGERCAIVVAMLADGQAVIDLLQGPNGLLTQFGPGDLLIDMGTSGIGHTSAARELLQGQGARLVEAPVSGSTAAATNKALLVMAAGDTQDVDAAMPALESIAGNVTRIGGHGAGAAMKLAVNSVLFGLNQGIAEALVLAERAGIDRSDAYEIFATSAIGAPVVQYRRNVFEDPRSAPVTFTVDLATKDLSLVLELAERVGTAMPQAESTLAIMEATSASGLGDHDMGEVATYLRGGQP
jgi:3-hydroxyisobutyrate dehydrogenase-like beta-hydroxyacid dehydrogenase